MPPKPSLLLLEIVEFGELAWESDSASESLPSFKLLGRRGFGGLLKKKITKEFTVLASLCIL